MKNMICFGLWLMVLLPSAAPGQKENDHAKIAERLVRTALEDEKGYELLRELCEIGPRLCGSEGSGKAISWAKATMEKMGLDRVTLQSVTVPHWERGDVEVAEIETSALYPGRKLCICALGCSPGTSPEGTVAGVLEVKSFEELAARKEEARGKFIFFNRPVDRGLTNTFAGYGSGINQRIRGAIEAARVDAAGAIVRSITTARDNVPHTGVVSYEDGLPRLPAVAIGVRDADFLSRALREDPALTVRLKLSCRMLGPEQSYNVMAELTGCEKPEEVIVVGGHFDAWDKGQGAHDDGAGCIQSLEVLYLFKKLGVRPRRTVRCVFFMNEEMGLEGAREYGRIAAASDEIHVAAIESDRGAFTPRGFTVQSEDPALLGRLTGFLPYLQRAQIEWVRTGGSGADISQIRNCRALIGYVPDSQRYFDVHHSANDVLESVHPREMELGSAAMAILAYLLSEEGL